MCMCSVLDIFKSTSCIDLLKGMYIGVHKGQTSIKVLFDTPELTMMLNVRKKKQHSKNSTSQSHCLAKGKLPLGSK